VLGRYRFEAAGEGDLEQIHRLNHATFVREVPEHADPGDGRLVDRFHDKNLYFVARAGERVVGMVAVHDEPPFSIADKLADARGALGRLGPRPLEVRLLAIDRAHRGTRVFVGLGARVLEHARAHGHSHLLISGLEERRELYERLGFVALGPPVPVGDARFVPMAAVCDRMPAAVERDAAWVAWRGRDGGTTRRFTPGLVTPTDAVARALRAPPVEHRSRAFTAMLGRVRAALRALGAGLEPAVLVGTGTTANDAMLATFAAARPGARVLVLVNGEFGRRLAGQARRVGLEVEALVMPWGRPFALGDVDRRLARGRHVLLVGTHVETSTGMLNDVAGWLDVARGRGALVALDGVASLGAVPWRADPALVLASAAAHKALGAVAGLACVLARPAWLAEVPAGRVPASLDVRAAVACRGARTTMPSPWLAALEAALETRFAGSRAEATLAAVARLGRRARAGLRALGWEPLVTERHAAPHVTTLAPPRGLAAARVLATAADAGLELGGRSRYLAERGWVQVATMGATGDADVDALLAHLERAWGRAREDGRRAAGRRAAGA